MLNNLFRVIYGQNNKRFLFEDENYTVPKIANKTQLQFRVFNSYETIQSKRILLRNILFW